jgi:hypothetical protein
MRKLKPRWIVATVLLTLGIAGVVFPFVRPDKALTELEEPRCTPKPGGDSEDSGAGWPRREVT